MKIRRPGGSQLGATGAAPSRGHTGYWEPHLPEPLLCSRRKLRAVQPRPPCTGAWDEGCPCCGACALSDGVPGGAELWRHVGPSLGQATASPATC